MLHSASTMDQDHMLPEHPPSYHDPQTLNFPAVPKTEVPPKHHDRTLPSPTTAPTDLRTRPEPVTETPFVWPSSNPLTAYYQPGPSQLSPKNKTTPGMDSPSFMDIDASDRGRRGASVLSINKDDLDVRIAAEALGSLRTGMLTEECKPPHTNWSLDFIQSPPQNHAPLPSSGPQSMQQTGSQNPEPLLSLLTTRLRI